MVLDLEFPSPRLYDLLSVFPDLLGITKLPTVSRTLKPLWRWLLFVFGKCKQVQKMLCFISQQNNRSMCRDSQETTKQVRGAQRHGVSEIVTIQLHTAALMFWKIDETAFQLFSGTSAHFHIDHLANEKPLYAFARISDTNQRGKISNCCLQPTRNRQNASHCTNVQVRAFCCLIVFQKFLEEMSLFGH